MEREGFTHVPKNLQFRVGLLIGLTVMVAAGFTIFALYSRGVFEATQRLTLVSDNAEGVSLGMDLTFSGFPIGRVERISLGDDGRARILVEVPRKDAKWLRASSIFTLERGIVGGARIRAFSGNLQDPPLPDDAERQVLRGDTQEEIPRMVATLRAVLDNIEQMTGTGGSLQASLGNLRTMTDRHAGKHGALGAVLGDEDNAQKVILALDRANALLASLGGVSRRIDGVVGKADQRMFGEGGVVDGTQRAVNQANDILGELRESLKRVDKILEDAQAVSANAKAATSDLAALRTEVDANLRKVTGLIDEINRKWRSSAKPKFACPDPASCRMRGRAAAARLADQCRAGAAVVPATLLRRRDQPRGGGIQECQGAARKDGKGRPDRARRAGALRGARSELGVRRLSGIRSAALRRARGGDCVRRLPFRQGVAPDRR